LQQTTLTEVVVAIVLLQLQPKE
jgi:hypothetical protein